jgi:hypothetical protein
MAMELLQHEDAGKRPKTRLTGIKFIQGIGIISATCLLVIFSPLLFV